MSLLASQGERKVGLALLRTGKQTRILHEPFTYVHAYIHVQRYSGASCALRMVRDVV